MKLSIITPSFNQAQFLPFNLSSVSEQMGPEVEHIIVDPGSTDGSTEIARRANGKILIAEPDRGQSDGISKGFSRATGHILTWLNSDDLYPDSDVLGDVSIIFENNPDVDVVYGGVNFVDEKGNFLRKGFVNPNEDQLLRSFEYQVGIVQPGLFMRRRVFEQVGGPSDQFEYCMDYEYWVRIAKAGFKWKFVPRVFAHHRWWGGMKTSSRRDLSLREHFKVCDQYFGYVHWKWLDRYADYLSSKQDGVVNHATHIPAEEKGFAIRQAIDEVVTQEMLHTMEHSSEPEKTATAQYIREHHPNKKRIYFAINELHIAAEDGGDPKAMDRKAWHIFDAVEKNGNRFSAYHVPGNFDRYFDRDWHKNQLERAKDALVRMAQERRSDTCVIVGNGPSLRKSDLSLLANVDTIMSNFAVMSRELSRYGKILTVVNDLVAKQGAIEFNASPFIKVVPFWLANYFNDDEKTFFVNATVRPEFSKDFSLAASWRSTVSFFNMQLAYTLGYRRVLLIGFDHSYVQPRDVAEGVVISQKEDDENHFDPRYFKGKDWQAADTSNMEKMYVLAKAAFEANDREIVNCTIGGKLEVFRRGDLAAELCYASPHPKASHSLPGLGNNSVYPRLLIADSTLGDATKVKEYPRLLVVDLTGMGGLAATSRIKDAFFGRWPDAKLRLVNVKGGGANRHLTFSNKSGEDLKAENGGDEVMRAAIEYAPEVLYYRAVDDKLVHEFALRLMDTLGIPLVIHIMDDWPTRLAKNNHEQFTYFDQSLRLLFSSAVARLSIGEKMADVFKKRYGVDFSPFANAVDPASFPPRIKATIPNRPFVMRYTGALAKDMTFDSICEVAEAVEDLASEFNIRLEIYTREPWKAEAIKRFSSLKSVSVLDQVPAQDYNVLLQEADALLIAYNFDDNSQAYVGYSMANKLPEYLASGTPVVVYGPPASATVAYARERGCVQLIEQRDPQIIRHKIRSLVMSTDLQVKLGRAGRETAFLRHNIWKVSNDLHRLLISAAGSGPGVLIGSYTRGNSAHWDETNCVAELFSTTVSGSTMIDVGAHFGTALAPFLDMGWRIFAFEPDEKNREKLLERLAKHASGNLVKLDTRAVSNESRSGLSFYRSEESTGISGLSAFHPSHKAEQTVDTVTLTEVLAGESISAVDFLKIDTEGHDLFVLKGFPWDRFRPAVIECEFEDSKTVPLGYTFHDLASYLVEKGYTIYVSEWHPIVRYGIRHDWNRLVRYPSELADPKGWGNLLAFRDPIDEAVLVAAVQKVMKIGAPPVKKSPTLASAPVAKKVVAPSTSPAVPSAGAVIVPPPYRVLPGPFKQLASSLWHYQLSEQQTKRFWEAVFNRPVPAGQVLAGGLTVESDREMKIRVTLGRAGDAPYEGRQKTLPLSPGQVQKVVLEHPFSREHSSVKVQIEVLSFKGEAANLSIKEVFVHEGTVTIPPAPVAPLRKPDPVAHVPLQAPAAKTLFAERLAVRMGRPIEGRNWSAPGKAERISVRWAAAGQRATLALPVQRDREMLVVVACHPDGAKDRLDQLKVEIDGVVLPHTVYGDITPVCIVVRMPARTETSHTATELALLVPEAPESAPVNGKPLGLAVSAVSVLPTRPENTAKPELPGPRWSRRLMRLVDRRDRAKVPFPFSHFDGVTYLAENPDVAENVLAGRMPSALVHYQRYGVKEKRRLVLALTRHPNEGGLADIFDGCAYLEAYPDVAAAVRSESIASALEHYVRYGRSEGRKVGTSFDGSACRGTALDLVRLEAGRELRATLHGVKQQLTQDLAMQIGQVGSRLAKMESAVSSLARATEVEALRAEFRKDLALCARTADLQTVRHDFTASLDALRQETDKRAGQLAGEIRDRFSTAACATDLTRMEQATAQTMERLGARIDDLDRTEQLSRDRMELLHSELTDADRLASQRVERLQGDMEIIWQELESDAQGLRKDLNGALDRLRSERDVREGELSREIQEGLSRAARASELVRVEQLGKQNMEQLYDAVRAMKGEMEAKAEAVQQELHGGLAERARVDDLERIERLGLDRLERLQAELETVRNELGTKAIALRQELEQGLDERVRAEDLERMELLTGNRLERLHAELEAVRGELGAKAVALRQELEQGLKDRARHDELERVEQRAGDRWELAQTELAALAAVREAREAALTSQLETVKAGFELAAAKVELADVKHSSLQRDMELEANHLRTQVVGIDQRLSSADASVRKLTEGLDQLQKQQTTDHARLTHPNSYAFNVIGYQAFARQLTMANAGRLAKHWGPLLGVTIPEKELFYLAHRICQIENACLGRLATSIDAILLRSLVARAAGHPGVEVLEIGTLFGLGIIAMHEAIAPLFERVHFTALDPLEGYYGKEHRDVVTGVPVSRAVFDENLRRAGIPGDRVTVIQHLSTDEIAREEARKTCYGLLVIDGDHRYDGVKHDLESYLGTVRPGGYVLVDDYGNPSWPDVKNYVDAEVLGRKDLELVGSDWHTAVFRVAGAH